MILVALSISIITSGCTAPKLADADAALKRGEYFEAQKIYRQIYNKHNKREDRSLRGEIALKLGHCYTRLNIPAKASAAWQNAIRYNNPDSTALLMLGRSLQAEGKYAKAAEAYKEYLNRVPGNHTATVGLKGCELALASKNKPKTRYVVKNAKLFNTRRADFSPRFLDNTFDRLYFTSTNEKATGQNRSAITGMKNSDIMVASKNERGEWMRPEPAEGEINTEHDEGVVAFSPDGQTMYLTVARRTSGSDTSVEIYTSRRSDASWAAPVKYEISGDTLSAVGHPSVSPDGRFLYFSSDMPGGFGGLDIWRINLFERAGSLENMGPQINTPGNECFPTSRADSVLYFSSDGHPGFGGLDLFRADLNSTGDFWSVRNMGVPINSQGDDFGITFGPGESGFFSSNRGDAKGYDHLYSFLLPEIKVSISGYVLDKDEEPVANAVIRIVGDDGSNQKGISRNDGSFSFRLDRGVKYVMKAGAEGYLNVKQEFESDPAEEDADYAVDFILAAVNKPQVVENIFYDFDKATLRHESKSALDELAQMLRENPHVSIELGAHTDRKGSIEYNTRLSERRAKSVNDYLAAAGIDPERLSSKGYGETTPKTITKKLNREYPQFPEGTVLTEQFIETLDPENQAAADQINRRTEFRVLSLDFGLDME